MYAIRSYYGDRSRGASLLEGYLDECFSLRKREDPELAELLRGFLADPSRDAAFDQWIMGFHRGKTGVTAALLLGLALDAELLRQDSFRFFLCFWALSVYANPSLIEIRITSYNVCYTKLLRCM